MSTTTVKPPSLYGRIKHRYKTWSTKIVDLTSDKDTAIYGEGWNRLGYHRPVGRFIYTFGLLIPEAIFGMLLLPLLKLTEYRSPVIGSYETMAAALFGAMYVILDLELQSAVDRFVPQYAISDPKKAMQYVTFFIKYQMWSGLIQIMFVAVFLFLYVVPYTNFTFLAWFILLINIKQYPAILSTFSSVITSLQHGAKEKLIVFYRASIITPLLRTFGGLIGLYWGQANPAYGESLGMALGFMIGAYLSDFFTFLIGMSWLSKILDRYNIRMWEIYGQSVPDDVWRSALSYSFRLLPKTIFDSVIGLFNFLIQVEGLPGYVSYQGIFKMSNDLRKFVGWSDDILNGSQPAFSEAFNNGKVTLTKYYIGEGLKYNYLFFMILGGVNIFGLPIIFNVALSVFFSSEWSMVVVIVPIQIALLTLLSPYDDIANKMIYISGHPEINTTWGIIATIMNTFFTWYFLFVLELGWLGIILSGVPSLYLGVAVKWIFMNKRIIKLDLAFWKDIAWQCFIAPLVGGAIFIGYMLFILTGLWPIISAPFSGDAILIPAIISIVLLLLGVVFLYLPLVSYFGFWDERSLMTFRRAVSLSGPSLWLVWPMYKIFNHFHKKSPFKARAYVKMGEAAEKELQELSLLRAEKFAKFVKTQEEE